jgi:hypothetical protein
MDSPAVSGVSWSLHTLVDVAGTGRSDDPIPLSLLVERLHAGLDLIDTDVVSAFSPVLPRGRYLISLMQIEPVLVYPYDDLDYWTHESVLLFGRPVPFGELPHYTATPYYRIGSHVLEPQGEQFILRKVKSESERDFETVEHQRRAAIYAMVAPMIPTTILDRTAIEAYRKDRLGTAVAVSILDARCPGVMKREAVAPGIDGSTRIGAGRIWSLTDTIACSRRRWKRGLSHSYRSRLWMRASRKTGK